MSIVRKCLLTDIFSYENYRNSENQINSKDIDVQFYASLASYPFRTYLLYGNKKTTINPLHGIITCHDYQTIDWIIQMAKFSPKISLALLLNSFIQKNIKTLFVVLNVEQYVSRSVKINLKWCKRLWSLQARAHMISFAGVYYSVLGGAFCSLGKSNSKYAYKAGALAIEQIKLAKRLKDNILECKCWLYYAEDLIQLGKLDKAQKIIVQQEEFVQKNDDPTLRSMLEAVIQKMDIAKNKSLED